MTALQPLDVGGDELAPPAWHRRRRRLGRRRAGGRPFYWRQLRDMKGSVETDLLKGPGLQMLATSCGWALARGHARSGHRIAVASYLGVSDRFDQGIADFATSYADQAEKDHAALLKAIKQGKISVETEI